jgi:foldase protein PrsA
MPTDAPASTATVAPQVEAAAMVNGEPIPMSEYEAQVALAEAAFRRQMGNNPQLDDPDAALQQVRRQVLDWMVDQKLMEQAAERLGVSVSPERVDAEFARAQGDNPVQFSEWLEDNGLTAQDFRVKLRAELLGTKMRDTVTEYLPEKMEQVHLRHILVNSRSQAESILDQIHSNEDFVRLAKEYSKDMSTRDNGGDLGFYPRGVLSPEIDRVAFNMVVGQVSDVIQTAFGYHIIQVLERSPQRELTPQMERALRQQMFMDWLAAERAKAEIVYLIE